MDIAWITLVLFVVTLVAGIVFKIHLGALSIVVSFLLGFFVYSKSGDPLSAGTTVKSLVALVDWSLWLQIIGCAMMASIARDDGTLDKIGKGFCALLRGNRKLYYFAIVAFTTLASYLGLSGQGLLSAMLPMLATISLQQGIPFVLMAAAYHCRNGYASVAYGNTPMVLLSQMNAAGIPYQQNGVIIHFTKVGFIISTLNLLVIFVLFGGLKLKRIPKEQLVKAERFTKDQIVTLCGLLFFAVACMLLKWAPGPSALIVCIVLCLIKKIDITSLYKKVPWSTLILLTGTTMFIGVVKTAGGIELLVEGIKSLIGTNAFLVTPLIILAAGLLSLVSSNQSVVIPTFVPIAAAIAPMYGLSAEGLSSAIAYGGYATGITPLSVTGSQYLAYYATANASQEQQLRCFRDLFLLGFTVLGLNILWGMLGVFQLFT